ncbi:hypothetical protein C8Q75DRAFT_835969 [Abortiporus biennis]|nr:hypothetical protein C8Q75DRAFT_835969 [Abortiporus biennis]
MNPFNKPNSASPYYSLYQWEIFKAGGTKGQLPSFFVHSDELQELTKNKLNNCGYFYANSNTGLDWTDRANREAFYRWCIIPCALVDTNTRDLTITIFGHKISIPIMFVPIGINKLYSPLGELIPVKIAEELGIPIISSNSIEDVVVANDKGASIPNESNSVHEYYESQTPLKLEPNGRNAKSSHFFQLYMGHDDEITLSLLNRAWNSNFDVGNEVRTSDPVFIKKHADELVNDSGKWIDSSIKWLIGEWCCISNGRPFVMKGIQCAVDTQKALEVGCDGIVVTNYAGRQVNGAVTSLEALSKIVETVSNKIMIIFDSSIHTGADVFKALTLGAHVIMVGHLYGEAGCCHVMKSLLVDLDIMMTVAGYQSITIDVYHNKDALKYNSYGIYPHGEHARL